jgi:hypothetical protein
MEGAVAVGVLEELEAVHTAHNKFHNNERSFKDGDLYSGCVGGSALFGFYG